MKTMPPLNEMLASVPADIQQEVDWRSPSERTVEQFCLRQRKSLSLYSVDTL